MQASRSGARRGRNPAQATIRIKEKMDEQEFKNESSRAMESLFKKLSKATELYEFEPDFNSGALSIEFEQPKAKFVVSPNAPVRQIWVSAHSKSFKLDWDAPRAAFVLPATGQTLEQMIAGAISQHLNEEVTL
jgi:iron donor protein CyaY